MRKTFNIKETNISWKGGFRGNRQIQHRAQKNLLKKIPKIYTSRERKEKLQPWKNISNL